MKCGRGLYLKVNAVVVLYSVKYLLGIKCLNFSGIVNKSVVHLYSEKYLRYPVFKLDWFCK